MFSVKTMSLMITAISFVITWLCLNNAQASDHNQLRLMAPKHNMTCILVFDDSSVDPGNNNRLSTRVKCNFLPYGKDFLKGHLPSGRFCNGRLPTDFLAEAFGYTDLVTAFLDPNITRNDLLHTVSFASAGAGYDEFTANISNVLSLLKQLDYLRHYKIQLRNLVGTKESEDIIRNALFVMSVGSNDFLLDYYLMSGMRATLKTMNSLGARKLVVVGVPPFGCLPQKYGFTETLKACCGTGTYEFGNSCKDLSTCSDRTKYMFWDAAHFTEKMYKVVADTAVELLLNSIF